MKKRAGVALQLRDLTSTIILILSLFVFSTSCKDNSVSPEPIKDLTFEEVLNRGGDFESVPDYRTTDTVAVGEPENNDFETTDPNGSSITQRFVCKTKTLKVLDGNGQFPLFDSNADVIYPGNLLQGKTLTAATPSPIVVKRAGGTISYNLNNGNLNSSFSVDEVKKSTIQDGMNNIIAGAGEVVPANFQLEIEEVHSESQLALEMGIDVKKWTTKVSSNMSFSTEHKYNRFLVKLNQQYYTMSFDLPTRLDELFNDSVTPEELSKYVQEDNPATFISSVTYGRIYYMLVESTSSSREMKAKLDISYGSFGNNVKGEVEVDAFNSLGNVKIKVIAYGGDAKGTFQLTGETSINNIANKLAESTDIRAGLPLSYVVRRVERPDIIVGTKLATEYDIVECRLKGVLPPAGFSPLVDLFEDGIGAATQINGSLVVLYNSAGTEYVIFDGVSSEISERYTIDDPDGPMGVSSFDAVTAALRATKIWTTNSIRIFNGDGTKFETYKYQDQAGLPSTVFGSYTNKDGSNVVQAVSDYYSQDVVSKPKDFPFVGDGFKAAVLTKLEYKTDKNWPKTWESWTWTGNHEYFSAQSKGSACAKFKEKDYRVWKLNWDLSTTTTHTTTLTWEAEKELSSVEAFPFNHIEAACKMDFHNDQKILYFSQDGQFSLYTLSDNTYKTPWVIN